MTENTETLIQVWSSDHSKRKAFMAEPTILAVIRKAKQYGLPGNILKELKSGNEICDDEVLELYTKMNATLIILNEVKTHQPHLDKNRGSNPAHQPNLHKHRGSNPAHQPNLDKHRGSNPAHQPNLHKHRSTNPIREQIFDITCSETSTSERISTVPLSSTRMCTDDAPSTSTCSSKNLNPSAKLLLGQFQIPWEKVPQDVMELLIQKQSLGKKLNVFCNFVVDELRKISAYIPVAEFRSVAIQAANKYPDSFQERDRDGVLISVTPKILLTKMINRNNTLNRPPKRVPPPTTLAPPIPVKQRKIAHIFQNTCQNWSPPIFLTSKADLVKKKEELKELYMRGTTTAADREIITTYMKDCYALQRSFLNNRDEIPSVDDIKREWPFIFQKEHIFAHFESLMGKNPTIFQNNFMKKKKTLWAFVVSSKIICLTETKENDANVLKGIALHFKEDVSLIFKSFKYGTSVQRLEEEVPVNAPWVAFVDEEIDPAKTSTRAFFFFEKQLVSQQVCNHDIVGALIQLLCYYYAFNVMFPKDITLTMEFLVRFFFQHYPENVRGAKNKITNISKINNLITKLNAYNV